MITQKSRSYPLTKNWRWRKYWWWRASHWYKEQLEAIRNFDAQIPELTKQLGTVRAAPMSFSRVTHELAVAVSTTGHQQLLQCNGPHPESVHTHAHQRENLALFHLNRWFLGWLRKFWVVKTAVAAASWSAKRRPWWAVKADQGWSERKLLTAHRRSFWQ